MANVTTTGLVAFQSSAIAVDGGFGTTFTEVGLVNADSVVLDTSDPELTQFFAEQVDDAVYESSRKGTTTLELDLGFADLAQIQKFLGGTITGSGDDAVWNAPLTPPNIELSFKLVPTVGYVLNVVRGKVTAKITGGFIKTDNMKVHLLITFLLPKKAATAPYFFTLVEAE